MKEEKQKEKEKKGNIVGGSIYMGERWEVENNGV
jgi:hypothetical protein